MHEKLFINRCHASSAPVEVHNYPWAEGARSLGVCGAEVGVEPRQHDLTAAVLNVFRVDSNHVGPTYERAHQARENTISIILHAERWLHVKPPHKIVWNAKRITHGPTPPQYFVPFG
jgi:hypothetical protein